MLNKHYACVHSVTGGVPWCLRCLWVTLVPPGSLCVWVPMVSQGVMMSQSAHGVPRCRGVRGCSWCPRVLWCPRVPTMSQGALVSKVLRF